MTNRDRFESSADADAHISQIKALVNDKRLGEWADSTDDHFNTNAANRLARLRKALEEFEAMLDQAC